MLYHGPHDDILDGLGAALCLEHGPEIRQRGYIVPETHHTAHRSIEEAIQHDGLIDYGLVPCTDVGHLIPGVVSGVASIPLLDAVVFKRPRVLRYAGRLCDGQDPRGCERPTEEDRLGLLGLRKAPVPEDVLQAMAELYPVLGDGLDGVVQASLDKVHQGRSQGVHPDPTLREPGLQDTADIVLGVPAQRGAQEHDRVIDVDARVVRDGIVLVQDMLVVGAVDKRDNLAPDQIPVEIVELRPKELAGIVEERRIHEEPEGDVFALQRALDVDPVGVVGGRDEKMIIVAAVAYRMVVALGVQILEHATGHGLNVPQGAGPVKRVARMQKPGHRDGRDARVRLGLHLELEPVVFEHETKAPDVVSPYQLECIVDGYEVSTSGGPARKVRVSVKILGAELEPRVLGLVIELNLPIVVPLWRDAVVLGDTDPPAQHISRVRARLHRVRSRMDDVQVSVARNIWSLTEALGTFRAVELVVGALRGHLQVEGELAIAHEEVRILCAPVLELFPGFLDQKIKRTRILLLHSKQGDVLPAELVRCFVCRLVSLHELLGVGTGLDQGHVNVKVVGHLDRADKLLDLVRKVGHPVRGHHEIVLHLDGDTIPSRERGIAPLGLREHAGPGLIRNPGSQALVVTPGLPLDLGIHVVMVLVR